MCPFLLRHGKPLSWQGALRVSARQVIHLHPEFIDCSECEQHLPFALQVLLKERIFPSIYIPTRERRIVPESAKKFSKVFCKQ